MELNEFEIERPRLSAIATRILGGSADVDDIVQEAHLKLSDADGVDDVPAWLTTVVTRLCLDRLRRRRSRLAAETAGVSPPERDDAQADVLLAEQVGDALQLVLDALAPAERATLVLHDVFGYPFDEVAQILGRSATAVRQLASRARRTVRGEPEPRARAENRAVVEAFLDAARGGDVATLLTLLAPDAVMRADLIGQQMGTEPVYDGATAVAERFNGARVRCRSRSTATSQQHGSPPARSRSRSCSMSMPGPFVRSS
ncbi:MAG: sigma-70 family RNA polymerase sigma factor [Ilumatobacteraceae bacterium]